MHSRARLIIASLIQNIFIRYFKIKSPHREQPPFAWQFCRVSIRYYLITIKFAYIHTNRLCSCLVLVHVTIAIVHYKQKFLHVGSSLKSIQIQELKLTENLIRTGKRSVLLCHAFEHQIVADYSPHHLRECICFWKSLSKIDVKSISIPSQKSPDLNQ